MRRVFFLSSILFFGLVISACCTAKKTKNTQDVPMVSMPGPKVIIYQTTKDYSTLVPIGLSDDKMTVVSYPDSKDVYFNGALAYPTQLHKGFLLDNRGISKNSAFIKLTYNEYSKLAKTPGAAQLYEMIVDKDPFISMYSCGIRSSFTDIEQELNLLIDGGNFSKFTKIK